ncbi:MAG: hypothetical protein ACLP7Q_17430 [Isosphaeraceae bacterium]
MTGSQNLNPIEAMVLVRFLTAGAKGLKTADLRKDLSPLLEHRWSGNALSEVLERALVKLASLRLVTYRPAKSKRAVPPADLTPEGRQAALALLALDELPARPKPSWASLKKTLLLVPALGASGPGSSLGKDDNLRAFLLKREYGLPVSDWPSLKEAKTEWLRKALGMGKQEKVTLETVQALLFRRELGDDRSEPASLKKSLDRLLARRLRARRDDTKELRDAILRNWVDRGLERSSPEKGALEKLPSQIPAAEASATLPEVYAGELDLASFSRKVLEAARSSPSGWYGDNKVFIVHAWRALEHQPELAGIDLDTFKRRLAEANNARLLDLARADLVQAMDPEDVRLSELSYLNATFHFIRIDSQRP